MRLILRGYNVFFRLWHYCRYSPTQSLQCHCLPILTPLFLFSNYGPVMSLSPDFDTIVILKLRAYYVVISGFWHYCYSQTTGLLCRYLRILTLLLFSNYGPIMSLSPDFDTIVILKLRACYVVISGFWYYCYSQTTGLLCRYLGILILLLFSNYGPVTALCSLFCSAPVWGEGCACIPQQWRQGQRTSLSRCWRWVSSLLTWKPTQI